MRRSFNINFHAKYFLNTDNWVSSGETERREKSCQLNFRRIVSIFIFTISNPIIISPYFVRLFAEPPEKKHEKIYCSNRELLTSWHKNIYIYYYGQMSLYCCCCCCAAEEWYNSKEAEQMIKLFKYSLALAGKYHRIYSTLSMSPNTINNDKKIPEHCHTEFNTLCTQSWLV